MLDESLKDFIVETTGESHLRVQDDLGDGFVRLRAAEAQRRQAKQDIRSFEDVVIEMLRNARDAGATMIFVATWRDKHHRFMTMIDNGSGIPEPLHATVFEPFVTSKLDSFHADRWGVHGRGMALYSIKQNTNDARIIASAPGRGSVFFIEGSPSDLPEKADQSTLPRIVESEEGAPLLRGPHNIPRTVMEFAIDERKHIVVYMGTPTEIAATLYHLSDHASDGLSGLLVDEETLPYLQTFNFVHDPEDFSQRANEFGLPLSGRSARRIMNSEIAPLRPHLESLVEREVASATKTNGSHDSEKTLERISKDARGLKIADDDLERFKRQLMAAYDELAQSYYLETREPRIRVEKGSIRVVFPVEKLR